MTQSCNIAKFRRLLVPYKWPLWRSLSWHHKTIQRRLGNVKISGLLSELNQGFAHSITFHSRLSIRNLMSCECSHWSFIWIPKHVYIHTCSIGTFVLSMLMSRPYLLLLTLITLSISRCSRLSVIWSCQTPTEYCSVFHRSIKYSAGDHPALL